MARLLTFIATLLLLKCTLVTSQTFIALETTNITEGSAANVLVVDASQHFSSSSAILTIISGNNHPNVFNMYFEVSNDGRIVTTDVINRDAMAVELQQIHSPVLFEVSMYVLEFADVIKTVTVTLRILDSDNNVPTFPESPVHLLLSEGMPSVNEEANRFLPLAVDNDEGINTVHNYTLSPQNNEEGIFELEVRENGGFITGLRLVQTRALNREHRSSYILTIEATEGNSDPDSATLVVNITVLDVCDQPPQFLISRYFTEVEENSLERPIILPNITAMDSDIAPQITYTIRDVCSHRTENTPQCVAVPEDRSPFALDQERGDLRITRELDREEFAQYEITILAVDDCAATGTATVVVTVLNVNDNAPNVGISASSENILEGPTTGFSVYFLSVNDPDDGTRSDEFLFTFELYDNSTGVLMSTSLFEMQTTPPLQLRVVQPLDREVASGYMLVLNVTDWGTPNMSTIRQLPINVVDINDHSPVFEDIQESYTIMENFPQVEVIVTLRATDRDALESGNGRLTYILPQSNMSYPYQERFAIDQFGRLTANSTLDREELERLSVLVEARDNPNNGNTESRSDFIVVNLTLLDMNDNIPTILTPPEIVNISESQSINTVIFNVTASDSDTEPYSTLTFLLTPGDVPFQINPSTGVVTLESSLDHETRTSYTFCVKASDGSLIGRRMVTVLVQNENDERCVFDRNGPYLSSIRENGAPGFRVTDINASDRDTAQEQLRYDIMTGNERGHFRIDPSSGEIFTTEPLDHDDIRNYTLRVSCSDGSETPSETVVLVSVLDMNDNVPQFVGTPYNFTVSENLPEGAIVNRIQAVDADSNSNGAVRYRVLRTTPISVESWFMLDERTGVINTTQSLDRENSTLAGIANDRIILNVEAFDSPANGNDILADSILVYIQITDINDKKPVFARPNVTFQLPENYEVGRDFPFPIHATDADALPHNIIEYDISRQSTPHDLMLFRIIPDTGVLRLTTTLNFESNEEHRFVVQAIDTDMRNLQAMQTVIVLVENVAENNVTFVNFVTEMSVVENSPYNHTVTAFTVTDINETPLLVNLPRLTYSILNQDGTIPIDFAIRSDAANSRLIVYISGDIDRETQPVGDRQIVTRVFNITASDPDMSEQSHGSTSAILRVTILDENDNIPTFDRVSYVIEVAEESNDFFTPIGRVTATDRDFGNNGTLGITYHIPDSVPFAIDSNGYLRFTSRLDREAVSRYDFDVIATDGGPPDALRSSSVTLRVNVLDLNDNEPQFDTSQNRTFLVGEQESNNTIVAVLRVQDNDTGSFGQVNFTTGDVVSPFFHLEPNGSIILVQNLNREEMDSHFFTVFATDGGGLRTPADVNIVVEDYNDNAPIFNPVSTIQIQEDASVGMVFATVTAEDADIGNNGLVRYAIGNYSLQSVFGIDPTNGQISLLNQHRACVQYMNVADFEREGEYDVNIVAYDLGFPRHIVSKTIKIFVRPVNEHSPLFDKNFVLAYVNETQQSGVVVVRIRAVDADKDDLIHYEVLENNVTSSMFRYDQTLEAIVNTGVLDYNVKALYQLVIHARDNGDPPLVGSTQVVVGIHNINNHAPVFLPESIPVATNQRIEISESIPISTVVWTVKAVDEDNATHDAVSYFLEGGEGDFSIDSLTGEISVSASLDFEVRETYTLRAFARDTGSPQMTSIIPVTLMVAIQNENDQSPIFNATRYTFFFREKQPQGSVVGRVYAPDGDVGSFGDVQYSISDQNFEIDRITGEISTRILIDRDALAANEGTSSVSFQFQVLATDSAPGSAVRTASANVVIRIVDVNDNPPVFEQPQYLIRISPTHAVTNVLGILSVSDRDEEPNSEFRYEIVSNEGRSEEVPLTISSSGGLSLERNIPTAYQPVYIYTISAIDSGDTSLQSQVRLELIIETSNDHHPRFNPLSSTVAINELTSQGGTVFRLADVVADEDGGNNGQLSYLFAETYPSFQIDETGGVISLRDTLDYESTRSYNLTILAMDHRPGVHRTATGTITVNVEPGNEYPPEFMEMPSHLTLSHLPVLGLELFTAVAVDRDDGRDGEVEYNLIDATHLFSIDSETGVLKNQREITQDHNHYNITIGAYDLGNPFRSSNTTIRISIENPADDALPRFVGDNPRTFIQPETDSLDGFLNTALLTNPQAQTYHIVKQTVFGQTTPINMFSITSSEGRLSALLPLDHEEESQYSIVIESRIEAISGTTVRRMSDFLEVTLMVTDVNDNLPLFSALEDQAFRESMETGTALFRVHAIDDDSGEKGMVTYDIIQGDSENTFSINSTSGQVSLSQQLDRETVSEYDLVIRARDLSIQPQSSLMTVHVTIININDYATTYNGRNFSLDVYEYPHTVDGDRIVKLVAIDEDEDPPLTYLIHLVEASFLFQPLDVANIPNPFTIHHDTGLVTTTQTLDRESVDHYLLQVTASDRIHTAVTYLSISILDVNDHPPILSVPDDVEIWEGQPVGMLVTDEIRVTDEDIGVNSWVQFSLGDGWPEEDYFIIDPLSGVIRTRSVIVARENNLGFTGTIIAEDQGGNGQRATMSLFLSIVDVNDHPPLFESESIEFDLSITAERNTPIHHFEVTDEDFGVNSSPVMATLR